VADFVPWAQPKGWTPFARPSLAVVPPRAPEATPLTDETLSATAAENEVPPPDPPRPEPPPEPRSKVIEAEELVRARLEKADRERAAEHQARMEALEAELAAVQAERARIGELGDALLTLRGSLLQEMRTHTVDLVVTTAERVAGAALRADPALLLAMIEDAVSMLGDTLTVRISPEDEAMVRAALGDRPITLIADFSVRAGCVAHSPAGRLDASLDTAVAALRASAEPWARG
jgi:flagellar biosynthesis/type III secretory pathway protein FliH